MGLRCTDIERRYGGFVALAGVSFEAAKGEVLGIAGPNGAGKTTLFDVISGHIDCNRGRIELNDRDVSRWPAHRRARAGLARTFQSPLVPSELTVGETLEAACIASSPKLGRAEVAQARELVGLEAGDDVRSAVLDTLDRRRLLLCCLLLRTPSVLMLDEPCSGLLGDEIGDIEAMIRRVRDATGATVVVVEHRLELLAAIADRLIVLDEGAIIADGLPTDVFADPAVRAAYFEAPQAAA